MKRPVLSQLIEAFAFLVLAGAILAGLMIHINQTYGSGSGTIAFAIFFAGTLHALLLFAAARVVTLLTAIHAASATPRAATSTDHTEYLAEIARESRDAKALLRQLLRAYGHEPEA